MQLVSETRYSGKCIITKLMHLKYDSTIPYPDIYAQEIIYIFHGGRTDVTDIAYKMCTFQSAHHLESDFLRLSSSYLTNVQLLIDRDLPRRVFGRC